jgi:hypothetical protein
VHEEHKHIPLGGSSPADAVNSKKVSLNSIRIYRGVKKKEEEKRRREKKRKFHTEDTTEQEDLKGITILRTQLGLSGGVQQADLILAVGKDLLDTALLDLEALGGGEICGHLQLCGHRAEQKSGPAVVGFTRNAGIFECGPRAQLGIQMFDYEGWASHGGCRDRDVTEAGKLKK